MEARHDRRVAAPQPRLQASRVSRRNFDRDQRRRRSRPPARSPRPDARPPLSSFHFRPGAARASSPATASARRPISAAVSASMRSVGISSDGAAASRRPRASRAAPRSAAGRAEARAPSDRGACRFTRSSRPTDDPRLRSAEELVAAERDEVRPAIEDARRRGSRHGCRSPRGRAGRRSPSRRRREARFRARARELRDRGLFR